MKTSLEKFSILIDDVVTKNETVFKSLHIYKPLSEIEIKGFEREIGVKLPISYKEFLLKYGELFILGDGFLGSIDNPDRTLELKNDGHLLPGFVDVYELGDGTIFCIDTHKKNHNIESPVVLYCPGSEMTREDCDFISETVWNNFIAEGVDLSQHQHLKPKNKGWNYTESNI